MAPRWRGGRPRIQARAVAAAEDAFTTALAVATKLGMRPLAARCHLDCVRLYRRAGKVDDAHRHAEAARALATELGIPAWLEDVVSRGARVPR